MRIECIGGPLDGSIRVIHEGRAFVVMGPGGKSILGEYRPRTLMGFPMVVEGDNETVRADWHPAPTGTPE